MPTRPPVTGGLAVLATRFGRWLWISAAGIGLVLIGIVWAGVSSNFYYFDFGRALPTVMLVLLGLVLAGTYLEVRQATTVMLEVQRLDLDRRTAPFGFLGGTAGFPAQGPDEWTARPLPDSRIVADEERAIQRLGQPGRIGVLNQLTTGLFAIATVVGLAVVGISAANPVNRELSYYVGYEEATESLNLGFEPAQSDCEEGARIAAANGAYWSGGAIYADHVHEASYIEGCLDAVYGVPSPALPPRTTAPTVLPDREAAAPPAPTTRPSQSPAPAPTGSTTEPAPPPTSETPSVGGGGDLTAEQQVERINSGDPGVAQALPECVPDSAETCVFWHSTLQRMMIAVADGGNLYAICESAGDGTYGCLRSEFAQPMTEFLRGAIAVDGFVTDNSTVCLFFGEGSDVSVRCESLDGGPGPAAGPVPDTCDASAWGRAITMGAEDGAEFVCARLTAVGDMESRSAGFTIAHGTINCSVKDDGSVVCNQSPPNSSGFIVGPDQSGIAGGA